MSISELIGIGSEPDTTSCTIQETTDQQLNANLAQLVEILINALQDGSITVKNSTRLQNLTVQDILALAKANGPVQDITNYITENGTNIIEMIDSYSITRDTQFVTSGYLSFKIIMRSEPDLNDPTGLTYVEVPYIQAKLPYDLINKDRIVQIYLTTRDTEATTKTIDTIDNKIINDVIFDYTLDIDPTDPKAPYIFEARAKKFDLGLTQVYDVTTYPNDTSKWGTWGIEKFVRVTYLVDANWIPIPTEELPDITTPDVAMITSSNVIPMTYSLVNQTIDDPLSKPQESVNIEFDDIRMVNQLNEDTPFNGPENVNLISDPCWILIENSTQASEFQEYTNWLKTANKIISQGAYNFIWSPDSESVGLFENCNILVMPNNKIINQYTFDMVKRNYIKWGKDVGMSSKIIEITKNGALEFKFTNKRPSIGTIDGTESDYGLLMKLKDGEQYPFIFFEAVYIPSRIIEGITFDLKHAQHIMQLNVPVRIITEFNLYLNLLNFDQMVSYLPIPSRIVNFLASTDITYDDLVKPIFNPVRLIEERPESKVARTPYTESINTIKLGTRIINENLDSLKILTKDEAINKLNDPSRIISQIENNLIEIFDVNDGLDIIEVLHKDLSITLSKLFKYSPARIINQETLYPMKMEVSGGSTYYIQDLYNMRVISSLATEEYEPLVTANGRQQRSEYEFVAEQDQRVFTVTHTPDLVTVFRQGFKLSHGDFYSNGSMIILKSPANAGEIINIVSEKRYIFANTVSKEELENSLQQFKSTRPIITYPGSVYENSTVEIKLHNYDASAVYTVSLKFEGKYRDDILWSKRGDTIVVDVPEITNIARRTLSVIIYSNTMGKLQSVPTEATIHVKNLFDIDSNANGQDYKRLVFGAVPSEWLGMSNVVHSFDSYKTDLSTYSNMGALTIASGSVYEVPARIGILTNKWYQSKLLNSTITREFSGTYLEATVGLENLTNINLEIISSNGSETVFATKHTQVQIEEAFEKGTLYFIVDASTATNDSNYQIPNGPNFGNYKYSYKQALEYTPTLNILPRTLAEGTTKATYYLEHNNKLRGRNIHAAIILDFTLQTDFDFDGFANINEETNNIERTFPLESIEYKVQDNIPFLVGTINDVRIPNLTNPYVNIGSNVSIITGNANLDIPQKGNLVVNNLYAERIFSGLHTDLSLKDNFNDTKAIMNTSKYYKKFHPYSPATIYETAYKKDFFMLNEEDMSATGYNDKTIITMARFYSDLDIVTDNPTFSIRMKELGSIPISSDSFKGIYQIPSEDYSVGSDYQANFAVCQYGGSAEYIIDTAGTTSKIIEQTISFNKVYIKNSETIVSGKVPTAYSNVTDGYHTIIDSTITRRIPTWWDVVLRPSVRSSRSASLRDVWYLVRDNISLSDPNWLRITDGILRKPKVVADENINGLLHRDFEIINNPDNPHLFLMGGEGYRPTVKRISDVIITEDYLTSITPSTENAGKYYVNEAKWAYYNREKERGYYTTINVTNADGSITSKNVWVDDHGWYNQTEIMAIDYGWENGEPYVEYVWGKYFQWYQNDNVVSSIKLYVDRVSRTTCINTGIYHLNLSQLDNYNPGDNDIFPSFITKIYNSDFINLYAHPTDENIKISDISGIGSGLSVSQNFRPNFMDVIYESNAWWLLIRPAYSNDTTLYKMNFTASTGAFTFTKIKNLNYDNGMLSTDPIRINSNHSKWSLIPDITGTLRGDGPILIKHKELAPLKGLKEETYEYGIYYYDTWDDYLYKKSSTIIPVTSNLFGIKEVANIRNPYIMQLDPINYIEDKIDIVGSRFFVIIYLDDYLSQLTKEQFLLFKEELLHINNGISTANPSKLLTIFENITAMKIRAIIPDGDDYRSNSAQVIMERIATQTGRTATNFVFRITNNAVKTLEIDSVRFSTI